MNNPHKSDRPMGMEVNLKSLIENIFRYKFLFLISIPLCLAFAVVYIKLATPIYEVGTSLLIDPSGNSRKLGESEYIQGGVGLAEPDKNIFNEIGIIKSFGLVEKTVKELKFDLSYFSSNGYKDKEEYGYYPFEVIPDYTLPQLFYQPFSVEILSDTTYRLSTEAETFEVSNPATGTTRLIEKALMFQEVYTFGDTVAHDYFHFTIRKPSYPVVMDEFSESDLYFQLNPIEDVANAYLDKLEVNQIDIQASILDLKSGGPIVAKEVDFLNKLSENYIKSQLIERDEIAQNKEDFIQKQLANIADSLGRAERNLEAFRRNTQAVDLTQSGANALNQVQDLQSQKSQIDLNIRYFQSQLQALQDSASLDKIIAPSVVGINDPLLNQTLLELQRLYSEKTRLKFYKGAQSLDLELLNKQIENTTSNLQGNLQNLVQSSQLALANINNRISNQEGIISQLPSSEKQLLNFQRKSNLYENLFNYLSQELAKTGIAKAEEIPDTKILDEARMLGDGPVAPQKKLIIALAFIMGLLMPLAWIILYESIDETIQDINELEAHSNVQVLASIATNESKSDIAASELTEWKVEESFRDLTATLQFLIPDKTKNVIGITSTIPGEGKSFCAMHLGIHFAKAGKKIALINADFRKPSFLTMKLDKRKKDLVSFLENSQTSLKTIIHQHPDVPDLHLIMSNQEQQNPQILLSSPRFAVLIEELKLEYDYIIIDSPAIGLVSDYLLLTQFIEINLFVVRRKLSKISFLRNLDKLKKSGKLHNIYLLFNGAIGKSFKYGYSRYEYGSGSKQTNDKSRLKAIKNWLF